MWAWQFAKAQHVAERHGWTKFVTMQNQYNLVYREEEREMIPLCRDQGVGIIPWSPLARGFLTGNRPRGSTGETLRGRTDTIALSYYNDGDYTIVERVTEVARQRGVNNAQVALAWLLHKPGVTAPIVGASKVQHLDDAVTALDLQLSAEEIALLEEPYTPHPVLDHA
jgi:aryl-alcohol dehydrogenase (NADP+)